MPFVSVRRAISVAVVAAAFGSVARATPADEDDGVVVIDLAPGPDASFPEVVGAGADVAYFLAARTGGATAGLHRTDGRTAAPVPGVAGGRSFSFLDGTAWFAGSTADGTQVVARVAPGASSAEVVAGPAQGFASGTSAPAVVGGRIVFFGDDGVHGTEPFALDAATLALTPLAQTAAHDRVFTLGPLTVLGDRAVVWIYDPPPAWTPPLPYPPNPFDDPAALDGGTMTLWATDGTPGGTRPLRTYAGHPYGSEPLRIVPKGAAAGLAWFTDATPDGIARLWRTDGTADGTFPVTEEGVGAFGPMRDVGGRAAVFVTRVDFPWTIQSYLLLSDGTPAGTTLAGGPDPPGVLPSNWGLPDAAAGGVHFVGAHTLYATDGTTEPRVVRPAGGPVQPYALTDVGGRLVFGAGAVGQPASVWKSDGTLRGTRRVRDELTFPTLTGGFAAVGDRVVFVAGDETWGTELRSFPRAWLDAPVPPLFDTDLDGYPDRVEDALGTSIDDPAWRPLSMAPAKDGGAVALQRADVRIRFRRGRGTVRLRAAIPVAPGRPVQGDRLVVDFGGVVRGFQLDAAGAARTESGSLRLRARTTGGLTTGDAAARLDVVMTGADVVEALADEGFVAGTGRRPRVVPLDAPFLVFHAATRRSTTAAVRWRAGRASGVGR